jgi:Transposase DDE domain
MCVTGSLSHSEGQTNSRGKPSSAKTKVSGQHKIEKGIAYRKRRAADVEPVFANIKHNKNFKRFMLKGMAKAEIETGLLASAHNLGENGSLN